MSGKVSQIVKENLEEVINNLGFDLYDVEYKKQQNGMNLVLYISADKPITLMDCEKVHKTVDPILDKLNPTHDLPYYLNVSSVGLDRPLKTDKDFKRSLNNKVIVKLFVPINGQKQIEGILKEFDELSIKIEVEANKNKTIQSILRKDIANCKIEIQF